MIPGFDLVEFSHSAGPLAAVIVVAIIIFSESGLLIGFFLPGDSILFTLGVLLQGLGESNYGVNIHTTVALLYLAATTGYVIAYYFGKKVGPKLFNKPNSLLFKQKNVERAQDFYEKYGGKTVILARFIPIVRTFVPIIAGVGKMSFKAFMTYNIVGGILWICGVTYGGYFLGAWFESVGIEVDTVLLPIVVFILVASISPAIYQLLKDKKQRQAIWNATKLEVKKLLGKNGDN